MSALRRPDWLAPFFENGSLSTLSEFDANDGGALGPTTLCNLPARAAFWAAIACLLTLVACDTAERLTYENEGQVCVHWPSETAALSISVNPEACPSCCGTLLEAGCQARVEGESIFVEARTVFEVTHSRPPRPCCTACPNLRATCELPELPDGDYTINVGNNAFPYNKDRPSSQEDCVGVALSDSDPL